MTSKKITCDDRVYMTATGKCIGRAKNGNPIAASCNDCPVFDTAIDELEP